jgi:hypothetical protein
MGGHKIVAIPDPVLRQAQQEVLGRSVAPTVSLSNHEGVAPRIALSPKGVSSCGF